MGKPRVLFFDIESAGVNALRSDLGFVILFGYKWSDEKDAHVLKIDAKGLKAFDDSRLLQQASKLIEAADVVVGHYASVFDRRFIQGRLLINNLPAIPPTKLRDTWEMAKRVANFSSNRLKHLAKILKLKNQKLDNDWPTAWFKVMQGDRVTLDKLAVYCKGDVLVVEEFYNRIESFCAPPTLKTRLFNRREIRNGPLATPCWIWTGGLKNKRYGSITIDGRSWLTHVASYELFKGKVPDGLELDHRCCETICFNPDHLEPVTHSENLARSPKGNKAKISCPRGHAYKWTVRKDSDRPRRYCPTCTNERSRRRRQK